MPHYRTRYGYREIRKTKTLTAWANQMWAFAEKGARGRQLDFTISKEWVRSKLEKGTCEITEISFDLFYRNSPWVPSIDRIDSTLGYSEENCRMVVWAVNLAKGKWDDSVLLTISRAIVLNIDKLKLPR